MKVASAAILFLLLEPRHWIKVEFVATFSCQEDCRVITGITSVAILWSRIDAATKVRTCWTHFSFRFATSLRRAGIWGADEINTVVFYCLFMSTYSHSRSRVIWSVISFSRRSQRHSYQCSVLFAPKGVLRHSTLEVALLSLWRCARILVAWVWHWAKSALRVVFFT